MNPLVRRVLVVLGVMMVFALAPSAASGLSGAVQVQAPGNSPVHDDVPLSSLGDPITETYSFSGGDQDLTGYPLQSILDEAASANSRLSLKSVTAVQVDRPKQGMVTISKSDFDAGPPLFFEENGEMKFVDPSGPQILTFTNAIPAVKLVAATQKSVEIVALPTAAKAGETVNFSASITGLADGEDDVERWTFGDGTGEATSGKHSFAAKDTYTVTVRITGDQGFQGTDTENYVVGGKKEDKPKNDDEQDDPPTDDGTGYTPDYGGYTYPGGTGGGYGGYPGGTGSSPGPSSPTPATPKPEEQYEPPVDDGLITVTGELVSSSAPAATTAPGDAAAEPPAAVAPASDGFGLSSEAWTVIGLLALLGIGLVAEKRGSRLT